MLISLIKRLLSLGSLPEAPRSFENRRILLLNMVTLFAVGISIIVVIVHLSINNLAQAKMVSSSIFIVCLPTMLFQAYKKHNLARYWLLAGCFLMISAIFFHSVQLNLPTGTTYLLIILIPLIIILIDGSTSLILTALVILCGNVFLSYRYSLLEDFSIQVVYGLHINWIVISITVVFCLVFYKSSIMKVNRMIEKDKEKLVYANRTKNFLFAVISHDIRSPLSTLKQYLSLDPVLRNDPEQFMKHQEGLAKKVDEINQTLDDLLFWSKSQLQGMSNNPSFFQVSTIVRNVMVLNEEIIHQKGIILSINHQTDDLAWCDKDHLTVAIRNLVQNAIKFTSKGQMINITTAREGSKIRVSIEDTGKGMDEATLKSLNEGIIVESSLGTAGEVGMGLGLSLVSEMILKNSGKMEIKSQLAVGTQISILIPAAK